MAITAQTPAPAPYRLTGEQYDRIVASGALEGAPVELIDGIIVAVSPQGPQHYALIKRLTQHLGARLDLLEVQAPLAVKSDWRPEPDLALCERTPREHPGTALLVVEVAITAWDEAVRKLPGYAAAAIPLVWLVNAVERSVHVLTEPEAGAYRRERVLRSGDVLASPIEGIDDLPVADLFAVLDA